MTQTYESLKKLINEINIKINEPLNKYTFTKTGGIADFLVFPETKEQAKSIYKYALSQKIPITILGYGSNMIIKDGGVRGIVVSFAKMTDIKISGTKITVQSGVSIIQTSNFALLNGLTGFEFACGIPGSIGGAVYMNAGAYGGEISDIVSECLILDNEGNLLTLKKEEMNLEYRKSRISSEGLIVLEVSFELKKGNYETIKAKMDELTCLRELKQPLEYPSCGSVFKRPPGYFAGKLIQDCGLQGKQVGGAQISTKHAGFIVNVNEATGSDYLELIKYVQFVVKSKFNIKLETEVKIVGEDKLN